MPLPVATGSSRVAGLAPATRTQPSDGRLPLDLSVSMLAELGYLLVPGPPDDAEPAYLLIGLRPLPTRAHFDPERVDYWTVANGAPAPAEISWLSPTPASGRFAWGAIDMTDRLRARNRFVSFGGTVSVTRAAGLRVARFESDAPILLLTEHTGPADTFAASIGAFFATLRAASGEDVDVARQAALLNPCAVYGAYLEFAVRRYPPGIATEMAPPDLLATLRSERSRLRRSLASDARDGRELAGRIEQLTRRQSS